MSTFNPVVVWDLKQIEWLWARFFKYFHLLLLIIILPMFYTHLLPTQRFMTCDLLAYYDNLHPKFRFITLTQHLAGFSYCKVLETDTGLLNCSLYSSTYWEMVWPLQMVNWKGCGIGHLRCHTTKESIHFICFGSLPL